MLSRFNFNTAGFYFGLILRLALIFFGLPIIHNVWFAPFISHTINTPSLNPWQSFFVSNSSSIMSFPYGICMLLPLLIGGTLGKIITLGHLTVMGYSIAIGLIVLLFDYGVLCLLNQFNKNNNLKKLICYYWLSPIVIYIVYWHGQLDIIPVFFLLLSLYFLNQKKAIYAGLFMAAAISAKLSMFVAVPIILIYLYKTIKMRSCLKPFCFLLLLGLLIFIGPWLLSDAYFHMTINNPQVHKVGLLAFHFSPSVSVYILPIIYVLFLYFVWQVERMNQQLFYAFMGISFAIILIMTPASVGWYLWYIPFLVLYLINSSSRREQYAYFIISTVFVAFSIIFQKGIYLFGYTLNFSNLFHGLQYANDLQSLILTGLATLLMVFSYQMYIKGVKASDYYRLSRRPISIGLSGDSGTGKDTLAAAVSGLFDNQATASISGDDYHKWDRYEPMWKLLTHLDPRANNLDQYSMDVMSLMQGKTILTRHYDHATGRFSHVFSMEKKDVVVASGLHTLLISSLMEKFDVKIFLDMNESLRQFFKIKRDVYKRGHSVEKVLESIARRESDRNQYILPQKENADLIFQLFPLEDINKAFEISKDTPSPQLGLKVIMQSGFYHDPLMRYLVANCLCFVEAKIINTQSVELTVIGQVSKLDVCLGAKLLAPDLEDLLADEPVWQEGLLGVMQLIVLLQATYNLKKRLEE